MGLGTREYKVSIGISKFSYADSYNLRRGITVTTWMPVCGSHEAFEIGSRSSIWEVQWNSKSAS